MVQVFRFSFFVFLHTIAILGTVLFSYSLHLTQFSNIFKFFPDQIRFPEAEVDRLSIHLHRVMVRQRTYNHWLELLLEQQLSQDSQLASYRRRQGRPPVCVTKNEQRHSPQAHTEHHNAISQVLSSYLLYLDKLHFD